MRFKLVGALMLAAGLMAGTATAATRFINSSTGNPAKTGLASINFAMTNGVWDQDTMTLTDSEVAGLVNNDYIYLTSATVPAKAALYRVSDASGAAGGNVVLAYVSGTALADGRTDVASVVTDGPKQTFRDAGDDVGTGGTVYFEPGLTYDTGLSIIAGMAGDTITFTRRPSTTGLATITNGAASNALYVGAVGAGDYTFEYVTFQNAAGNNAYCVSHQSTGSTVRLNNCVLDQDRVTNQWGQVLTGTNENLYLTDCTVDSEGYGLHFACSGRVIISGGTLSWAASGGYYAGVALAGAPTSLVIHDVEIHGPAGDTLARDGQSTPLTAQMEYVQITNCTGDVGRIFYDSPRSAETDQDDEVSYISRFVLMNNTLEMTTTGNGNTWGAEVDGGATQTINDSPFDEILIVNNELTFSQAGATHCMFFAIGANNVRMIANKIIQSVSTADVVLAIKSDNGVYAYNTIYGPTTSKVLGVAGGSHNLFLHNTIYSPTDDAFSITLHQDSTFGGTIGQARFNTFVNNIFVTAGTDATDYALVGSSDQLDPSWHNWFDYNCYWSGGTNVAYIDADVAANLAALQARWAAWATSGPPGSLNDSHSVVGNPRLVGPTTGDFSLYANSAAWLGGCPYPSVIGGWVPDPRRKYSSSGDTGIFGPE